MSEGNIPVEGALKETKMPTEASVSASMADLLGGAGVPIIDQIPSAGGASGGWYSQLGQSYPPPLPSFTEYTWLDFSAKLGLSFGLAVLMVTAFVAMVAVIRWVARQNERDEELPRFVRRCGQRQRMAAQFATQQAAAVASERRGQGTWPAIAQQQQQPIKVPVRPVGSQSGSESPPLSSIIRTPGSSATELDIVIKRPAQVLRTALTHQTLHAV